MGQAGLGQALAAEHAGNFLHPLRAFDRLHPAGGALAAAFLAHQQMGVAQAAT
jgi:hypothetical protein